MYAVPRGFELAAQNIRPHYGGAAGREADIDLIWDICDNIRGGKSFLRLGRGRDLARDDKPALVP